MNVSVLYLTFFFSGTEHTMDELNRLTMDGVFSVTVDRPNEQETPFLTNFSRDILARANQEPFNENKVIEKNDVSGINTEM